MPDDKKISLDGIKEEIKSELTDTVQSLKPGEKSKGKKKKSVFKRIKIWIILLILVGIGFSVLYTSFKFMPNTEGEFTTISKASLEKYLKQANFQRLNMYITVLQLRMKKIKKIMIRIKFGIMWHMRES